uniref:Elongator complex protein 1 n=1 Tax=Graphocephala atropunctata TaxID=36148 RepID=A0A1B6LZ87_9HEMI
MKNLKLLVNIRHSLSDIENSQLLTVASPDDYSTKIFKRKGYVFVYNEGEVFAITPVEGTCSLLFSIKEQYKKNTKAVDMFYNGVLNSLNIALEIGDILTIPLQDDLSLMGGVECVVKIGPGIQAAALSPDTECTVFLSGNNSLILMGGNFDHINQTELFGSDQGKQNMVNVGWGKKETQFHGSEGKAAAKKKLTDKEMTNGSSTIDLNQKPNISWRGDSTLFAVSYWCDLKNLFRVKIFDNTGSLQCTSEYIPGLEGVLSWRPTGLIAMTQRLPNKHVICFMEKNGLKHGDFTLPPNIKVLELSWNAESTILSMVCVDQLLEQSCVLLWTTGNYHWYLKQRLNLSSAVAALQWDEMVGNLLHILLADGTYLAHQWVWSVDHSAGVASDDLAVVAVIDHCDLKLSAFKKSVIPPPMCAATITLPSPALQVMFPPSVVDSSEDLSPNDLCVYLSDGSLSFVKDVETTPRIHSTVTIDWKCEEMKLAFLPSPACLSHWLWLSRDQLLCVMYQDVSHLCMLQVDEHAATIVWTKPLEEAVLTISHKTGTSSALIQLSSGALLVFQDILSPAITLPEPCVSVRCVGEHIISRAYNNRLYVDEDLTADNVTSFFCLHNFLVMTLSSHELYVTSAEWGFKVQNDGGVCIGRRLERGATVVVAVNHSVVLQLPRGNLETIEPRALTLVTASRLLNTGEFKAVAQLLRRQRINLNLCVDHNPSAFLLSVHRFVAQVRDPQWLSVFLSELTDEDITRTMYAEHYKHVVGRGPPLPDKVARVCTALREAMTQSNEDREFYLQPILSTYVRAGQVGEAISLADSDQALSYLALLIDTDRLYDEALGVYNLEKALKIAGKSHKDPKEYVTYLNELREMDPAYMRFTIDKRLRKPQSALRNLSQCRDRTEECLEYVKSTELYTLALELFKDRPNEYRQICLLYGSHLQDKHLYEEAGLMLRRGGDVDKAIATLTRAGCWRQCLTLAVEHKYSEAAMAELHSALLSVLLGQQQLLDAAELHSLLGHHQEAVVCLVDARSWSRAIFLCHYHRQLQLVDSTVKPALLDSQSRSLSDLRAKMADMDKHSARLLVVRQRKANLDNNFDTLSDFQSDTSSLSSFSSNSSAGTRSTKNTRKAQRKLWSLKEGNPREEQALLYTITELIQNTERLTNEVHTTCLALAELGMDTEAGALHAAMTAALERSQQTKYSVWPASASAAKKTGSDADAIDPTFTDMQLSFPPTNCVSSSWRLNIYS